MTAAARQLPYLTMVICLGTMAAIAGGLAYFWPALLVLFDPARIGHQYYIPSESMLPTFEVNDRVDPLQVTPGALHRGAIVLFQAPGSARIDRIAAIGGDMVALKNGFVIVNGKPVAQRAMSTGPTLAEGTPTRLLLERFPGEDHWHRILDAKNTDQDDWAPVRVPTDALFVLGDNRDNAADSRFPPDAGGVSMVSLQQVIGVVDTVVWSAHRWRVGRPVDDLAPDRKAPQ